MKKFIISTTTFTLLFCFNVKAQQKYIAEAVLQGDGTQVLTIKDGSGKKTTISGKSNAEVQAANVMFVKLQPGASITRTKRAEQTLFVPHWAVLLKNGKQEIRWTDAAGKERVVTGARREAIQEKYFSYVKKEGISCGCTPPVTVNKAIHHSAKTATLAIQ